MRGRLEHFIYLLILFFIPSNLFCQLDIKNSKEAYNYWVRRGIIEIIFSSMEDYSKQLTEAEQRGKIQYYEKYVNEISKKDFQEIESSFKGIEQFLNNNSYSKTANIFFQPLKSNYEEQRPLNDHFLEVPDNYDNSLHWNEKKKEILNNYKNSIDNLTASFKDHKEKELNENLVSIFFRMDMENFGIFYWIYFRRFICLSIF